MQDFSASPREMVASFWRNRSLIYVLSKREVAGRYKGSNFGILWSFFNPIFMLAIYTLIFSIVFKARWEGAGESKVEFALILFVGLIVFNFFAECISKAPGLILSNANYVKKIVFPLEILAMVTVGSALFHMLISIVVWTIFYVIFFGLPSRTFFLLPVVLLPLLMTTLGATLFLSSLGVYFRDLSQLVSLVLSALLFLTPIFYPISALPENYERILRFNPISPEIEFMRKILVWGELPDPSDYLLYVMFSILFLFAGFFWFQRTRKGFSDVI
jgi:lipopolysaccharide transport system permease protein